MLEDDCMTSPGRLVHLVPARKFRDRIGVRRIVILAADAALETGVDLDWNSLDIENRCFRNPTFFIHHPPQNIQNQIANTYKMEITLTRLAS